MVDMKMTEFMNGKAVSLSKEEAETIRSRLVQHMRRTSFAPRNYKRTDRRLRVIHCRLDM